MTIELSTAEHASHSAGTAGAAGTAGPRGTAVQLGAFVQLGPSVGAGPSVEAGPSDQPGRMDADDLVIRMANGDAAAFTAFYRQLIDRVTLTVRLILVDRAQTEEVAQEVMLEAWLTAARFQPARSQASTWILFIARRRAVDRVRASQASRTRDLRVGIREWTPLAPDGADIAEGEFEQRRARNAIRGLPRDQRIVVIQHFYEDRSISDLAVMHGIALSTVRWRIREGLKKLRLALDDAEPIR